MKYYNIRKLIKKVPDAHYYWAIGERSNGKTYSVKDYCVEDYFRNGHELAIIRRWSEDFKGAKARTLFDDIVENGLVTKYSKGMYTGITYISDAWWFTSIDESGTIHLSEKPFAYAFAIGAQVHFKSTSFPRIGNVLFDEVLDRNYFKDEFILFQNLLSTIIRGRNGIKVFMLGNTVTKFCPYFAEMRMNHVQQMQQGTIDVYEGERRAKIAIEYINHESEGKLSDIYFAFDNPKLNMITNGEWEIPTYPHLPESYVRKQIIMFFFIEFYDNMIQCELIQGKNNIFVYAHRKTTDIHNDDDLIFSLDHSTNPYHFRTWYRKNDICSRIRFLFENDYFYYQDNEVGDIIANFVTESRKI